VLYDLAIVGGGIVGLATAYALRETLQDRLIVLEAEPGVGTHQTGHNSGVIHSGLYYRPGSLKARNCVEGREALYRFCAEHGIAHERCGKLVVATTKEEVARLGELEQRGRANGLQGLCRLGPDGIREREPHARGLAALLVPDTGIVHFPDVARACAREVAAAGGRIETGARVVGCRRAGGSLVVETTRGEFEARALVNCAGLHADRIARLAGLEPGVLIVPFRGEYYELLPERRSLVRHLIYPTPDPRFPFLGVHFTRTISGAVEAGPNAVLALAREGYTRTTVSLRDLAGMAAFPGTWRMAARYWRKGVEEYWRSISRRAFVAQLARLVPEITAADVRPAGAGVRAQALGRDGQLLDDFCLLEGEGMIHVLNAPSPAATASLSIGRTIAELARQRFGWTRPVPGL
jgi:L-2-hydroxyglutarate oxidase